LNINVIEFTWIRFWIQRVPCSFIDAEGNKVIMWRNYSLAVLFTLIIHHCLFNYYYYYHHIIIIIIIINIIIIISSSYHHHIIIIIIISSSSSSSYHIISYHIIGCSSRLSFLLLPTASWTWYGSSWPSDHSLYGIWNSGCFPPS